MSKALESKRYSMTLIAFFGIVISAWAKHFFPGISETLLVTAAGLAGTYIGMESWRKSDGGS